MLTKKRTILTALQKKELCLLKQIQEEEVDNIQNLINNLSYLDPLNAPEFISIDETVINQQVPNEEEIVSALFSNNNGDNNDANNNNIDIDNDITEVTPPLPPVSHKDALLAIEKVKLYFEQQSDKSQLTDD